MYGFFNTVPIEIDESAKIDGATHAQIFWRLIFPLVTPILAVVALLAFIAAFGDFILAKIVLISEEQLDARRRHVQWVSNQLVAQLGPVHGGRGASPRSRSSSCSSSLQRYIVGGLTAGSVKG